MAVLVLFTSLQNIVILSVNSHDSVKSTNVVCPHNGTYDFCDFLKNRRGHSTFVWQTITVFSLYLYCQTSSEFTCQNQCHFVSTPNTVEYRKRLFHSPDASPSTLSTSHSALHSTKYGATPVTVTRN